MAADFSDVVTEAESLLDTIKEARDNDPSYKTTDPDPDDDKVTRESNEDKVDNMGDALSLIQRSLRQVTEEWQRSRRNSQDKSFEVSRDN